MVPSHPDRTTPVSIEFDVCPHSMVEPVALVGRYRWCPTPSHPDRLPPLPFPSNLTCVRTRRSNRWPSQAGTDGPNPFSTSDLSHGTGSTIECGQGVGHLRRPSDSFPGPLSPRRPIYRSLPRSTSTGQRLLPVSVVGTRKIFTEQPPTRWTSTSTRPSGLRRPRPSQALAQSLLDQAQPPLLW